MEFEMKYICKSGIEFEDLMNVSIIANNIAEASFFTSKMKAIYYEFSNEAFGKQGFAFRIRKEDDDLVATLKFNAKYSEGLFEREEFSVCVDEIKPDLTVFKQFDVWNVLKEFGNEAQLSNPQNFKELVTTNFIRIGCDINFKNSLIEVVCDQGYVQAANKSEQINEFEIELKEGTIEDVLELGNLLEKELSLEKCSISKFARGLKLIK